MDVQAKVHRGLLSSFGWIAGLATFYVLSIGPAVWAWEKFPSLKNNKSKTTVLATIYAPMEQLKESPCKRLLHFYLGLLGLEGLISSNVPEWKAIMAKRLG